MSALDAGARLWARTTVTATGCWEWQGARGARGYGRISVAGKQVLTHRLAFELAVGPVPDGLFVLHSCDNPPCVNPSHLRAGTPKDNVDDMWARGLAVLARRQLLPATVVMVKALAHHGWSSRQLASLVGVDRTSVRRILDGRTYKEVPPPSAEVIEAFKNWAAA